jgi:tRNA-2-methylthio-N6-dimethylallyladenosine synthase
MSDGLIRAIAECGKICEHIHLPAQSGDNGILRVMNRKYTVEHYLNLINKIRKILNSKFQILNFKQIQSRIILRDKIQNPRNQSISITTDIIVGFPGETKKQFNNTAKLFREAKFDMAYISQYSPRPSTASSKIKDNVPKKEKKRREEELMKILRKTALANNKKYVGKIIEVLVEGRNKKGEWFGKARTNKQVRIKNLEFRIKNLIGEFVKVKINKVRNFGLEGKF